MMTRIQPFVLLLSFLLLLVDLLSITAAVDVAVVDTSRTHPTAEAESVAFGVSAVVDEADPAETEEKVANEREDGDSLPQKETKRVWGGREAESPVTPEVESEEGGTIEKEESDKHAEEIDIVLTALGLNEEEEKEEQSNEEEATKEPVKKGKTVWGSAASAGTTHATTGTGLGANESTVKEKTHPEYGAEKEDAAKGTKDRQPSSHIPFVASKVHHLQHHAPPQGFTLAARVFTDPHDKLAHFDIDEKQLSRVTLPYWDCGASGSTTSPLPLKNAYFRHTFAGPTSWRSSETEGMHPVLVVALSPCIVELSSGESLEFQAGDVILLEDVLLPGHRVRPVQASDSSNSNGLKLLFLTLPQQHLHAGRDHLSIRSATMTREKQDPCPDLAFLEVEDFDAPVEIPNPKPFLQPFRQGFWDARRIRLFALGTIGMSLSTLAADFLGKTAPLWLAVGIGGTCFVVGTTYAVTLAGDHILNELELWYERRRLKRSND
jgi:hypothetical protein